MKRAMDVCNILLYMCGIVLLPYNYLYSPVYFLMTPFEDIQSRVMLLM